MLSARLNDDGFGGQQIVGEVKNSGTESAEFIQPFATFRDAQGTVVDTAFTYAEKERITSGDTSPFNLLVISDVVKQQARTYDLGLEWQDLQGNQYTSDVLNNQPFTPSAVSARDIISFSSSSDGGGDGNGNDIGNGNGNGNGNDTKILPPPTPPPPPLPPPPPVDPEPPVEPEPPEEGEEEEEGGEEEEEGGEEEEG